MASKKPQEDNPPGAPAWMTTYGDMVTLVLTFFVLLFSFSTIDEAKWDDLVEAFTGIRFTVIQPLDPYAAVQGFEMASPRPSPAQQNNVEQQQKEAFDELYERIKESIEENNLSSMLSVDKSEDVILLRMTDSALFDSGKADIKPDALDLLRMVSLIFDEYEPNIEGIRIEGHTDNVPIHTAQFESNWELSTARATRVLQVFLANSIIPPAKYTASGYSEYHPVATNETEDGKAKNRRVDFVIQGVTIFEDDEEILP